MCSSPMNCSLRMNCTKACLQLATSMAELLRMSPLSRDLNRRFRKAPQNWVIRHANNSAWREVILLASLSMLIKLILILKLSSINYLKTNRGERQRVVTANDSSRVNNARRIKSFINRQVKLKENRDKIFAEKMMVKDKD